MGTIEFDTGFANVVVVYRAICFRPFVNEVLDAAVSHVTELGFFAEVGPLEVFVSRLVSRVESSRVHPEEGSERGGNTTRCPPACVARGFVLAFFFCSRCAELELFFIIRSFDVRPLAVL